MAEKPILFNTEMVRAILDGRKTQTRRLCKGQPQDGITSPETLGYEPPYKPGDILWVRETWQRIFDESGWHYEYKADHEDGQLQICNTPIGWRPSIHMPREAARLFLRIIDVRAERLQDMTPEDCMNDGSFNQYAVNLLGIAPLFGALWDSTLKNADIPKYGWFANPFVWVYEFEKIPNEEVIKDE